ncbi:LytR/AlgR family response regulator transcription factor [Peribacillus acanthi]|uniref:LytR/AlgR family response regulator transcription factor n=1 Tax=Peribacillus acanthi TaxID=2171554 RepID=UPI000D3E93C8|nr:LytTR family DNA-binding domain-containing protein [Peribacillus acanthi]
MEPIKIIIADDDLPSRKILSHFIRNLPDFQVVAEATDGDTLIQKIREESPEIVLADIQMPKVNGMEAVKTCRESMPELQVIFTTGYDDFAVEAFTLSAADYIVKPVERSRLFMALEKAKKTLQSYRSLASHQPAKKSGNRFIFKSNSSYSYLTLDDILFIEKEGKKTVLHTVDDRFETLESLQEIEERLPRYFYKTHRSFVVNLRKMLKIEPSGETYLGFFADCDKAAHISKLKIQEVQALMGE